MFKDISNNSDFPKTLLIRNTPEGMIWQIYHVDNFIQANYLSINANNNGFKGITLVDYQGGTETFPNWRMELARAFVNTLPDYIALKEGVKDVPVEEYNYDDY